MNFERALPIVHVAAAALIDPDGRILITQRPEGKAMAGLWEFPGGKVEEGELPEVALARELQEELALTVHGSCFMPFTFASHSYDSFHLFMPLFLCRRWEGAPQPLEGQAIKWVKPHEMMQYPMPPADVPLVSMLIDYL